MKNELISYQDLRVLAVSQGVADNKVSIGIWARLNGYYKKIKKENYKQTTYYFK